MRYLDLGPLDKIELNPEKPTFSWDFSECTDNSDQNARETDLKNWDGYPSRSLQSVFGRLMAYMSFPEDDWQRSALLAAYRQAFSSAFDQIFDDPIIKASVVGKYGADKAPEVLGMMEGLVRIHDREAVGAFPSNPPIKHGKIAYDDELAEKGVHQTRAAGLVLYLFRCLSAHDAEVASGASLNKVVFLLEEKYQFTRSEVMRAWSAGKSVSHLAAAWYEMAAIADSVSDYDRARWVPQFGPFADFGPCMQYLASFLVLAKEYQNFGLRYMPAGSKQTILDADKIWRLPEGLDMPMPRFEGHPGKLDDETLRVLKAYRAPKAI